MPPAPTNPSWEEKKKNLFFFLQKAVKSRKEKKGPGRERERERERNGGQVGIAVGS